MGLSLDHFGSELVECWSLWVLISERIRLYLLIKILLGAPEAAKQLNPQTTPTRELPKHVHPPRILPYATSIPDAAGQI